MSIMLMSLLEVTGQTSPNSKGARCILRRPQQQVGSCRLFINDVPETVGRDRYLKSGSHSSLTRHQMNTPSLVLEHQNSEAAIFSLLTSPETIIPTLHPRSVMALGGMGSR